MNKIQKLLYKFYYHLSWRTSGLQKGKRNDRPNLRNPTTSREILR